MTAKEAAERVPAGIHAICVLITSIWGPLMLAGSALGGSLHLRSVEAWAFGGFAPVFLASLILGLTVRSVVIGDSSGKGLKVEFDINAVYSELFRDRSLRNAITKVGLAPRQFIVFRRFSWLVSGLMVLASIILDATS